MPDFTVYEYPVPDGYPKMCTPTKPETRLPTSKIDIVPCEESDMEELAALIYDAFPDEFWDGHEREDRPDLAERTRRVGKHFSAWLKQPGFHAIKAVYPPTGELMGVAGWHESGPHHVYPTQYARFPGLTFPDYFVPCVWRDDMYAELGHDRLMGWNDADIEELKGYHNDKWAATWGDFDRARLAELGDRPHWYLAPLGCWEKWRGRGVGKELLMWGINRADEQGVPCILEALPNARPVYYHLGFEPTGRHGPGKDLQLVRPPQKRKVGVDTANGPANGIDV